MDPVLNPSSPGAGAPPLNWRVAANYASQSRIAVERIRLGRPNKSILMVGLRGVGKTVVLDRMRDDAEMSGIHSMRIEAPEGRSLPALLAPQLRQALLRLSRNAQAQELGHRALRALAGFAKALKVKYADVEVGLDFEPELGLADNGDLEHDLQALLEAVALAAQKARTALVMFVDELQYVEEEELAALITALHRAAQRQLLVTLVGAGLPQLRGRMGRAKSYAERLFDFPDIGALAPPEAAIAISKPLADSRWRLNPRHCRRSFNRLGAIPETKKWSKSKNRARIEFDGQRITISGKPSGYDPIKQCRAQAAWVQDYLKTSTSKRMPVRGVVTFPGWWVEQLPAVRGADLWVLNPKALAAWIAREPEILSEADAAMATLHLQQFVRNS